jgi:hypothetical protein
MRTIQRTLLPVVISVLLGWTIANAAASWTDQHLRIATNVEMMKGHLISALENYKIGEIPLAQGHAGHPLAEHYSALPPTFGKDHPDLDQALREALTRFQQGIKAPRDVMTYQREVETTFQVLDRVIETVLPAEVWRASAFQRAVLARLIKEIGEEYGEAVQKGKVVNLPEYQDAFGFLQRARILAEQFSAQFTERDRQRMRSLFTSLEEAIPGILPPSSPRPAQTVKKQTAALVEVLRGGVGKK